MKLDVNMVFAHPVLAPGSSDYTESGFEGTFTMGVTGDMQLQIAAVLSLQCKDLQKLVDREIAATGFFVFCPDTYVDRLIDAPLGESVHNFDARDYFGTVKLQPVVWSLRELPDWSPTSVHAEFGGQLPLPSAAVLAFGDPSSFTVDRQRLRPFESIFTLASADHLSAGEFQVNVEREQITIYAAPATKAAIEEIRNSPFGRHMLLNAVYLPAVMQVLHEVAESPHRYEGFRWHRVFAAKCAAAGVVPGSGDLLQNAQRLLASPFGKIEANRERMFG